MKSHVWFTLAALASSLISFNAACAVDMFIKIKDIEGESVKPGHEGEIDILAWNWGTSHTVKQRMKRPTRYSEVATNMDMTFTKKMDASSSDLFRFCNNGADLGKVELIVINPKREFDTIISIQFHDVTCVAYRISGSGDDAVPTESVSFNYSKIEFNYKQQNEDGTTQETELGYDLTKGKKV